MCGMNTMPKIMGGLGVDEADKKQALPNKDLFYPTPKIQAFVVSVWGKDFISLSCFVPCRVALLCERDKETLSWRRLFCQSA